jgi:hypothetical protein
VKGSSSAFCEDFVVEGSGSLNGMSLFSNSANSITGLRIRKFGSTTNNASLLFCEAGSFSDNLVISTDDAANTTEITVNKTTKNVGIGLVNASYKLDVTGNFRASTNAFVEGKMSIGTTAVPTYSQLIYAASGPALSTYQTATTGTTSADGTLIGFDNAGGDVILWNWENKSIRLGTTGIERFKIAGTGEIGVGTSSPITAFDVRSGAYAVSFEGVSRAENTNTGNFTFASHNKSAGSGAYTEAKYVADWAKTSGTTTTWAQYGEATATGSTNYAVYGSASGASTNYAVFCSGNGVYTGTWTSSSDRKLKKDIEPIQGALAAVMQLNPKSYLFRSDDPAYRSMNLATGLHYGFIAQELEIVLPSVVSNNVHITPDAPEKAVEFKSVNYTELIPILTQAIQEQQAQIELLKKEVEALKANKK